MGVSNVTPIAPHLSTIQAPALLRALQGWLVWRFEHTAGEKKPRKVPYYINGSRRMGANGSARDRANLATFDAAKQAAIRKGFDGVGLALMPEFGVTALDFDDCVTASGIDPQVEALTTGTYAEFSPSGKGVRAFVLGTLGDNKDCVSASQPIGFETFTSKGYVTFTGNPTELTTIIGCENDIAPVTQALEAFCTTRFTKQRNAEPYAGSGEPPLGLTEEQIVQLLAALPSDLSYDDWVRTGMAVHHETQGDGFGVWDSWSSNSPKYTSTEYSTERWVSFGINHGIAPFTARSLIRFAQELGADPGINIDTASPDDFEALPISSTGRFNIRTHAEFAAQVRSVSWIVKDFLPHAQLGVLFGESGSGKSFLAYDLCVAISRGIEWNGRKVKKGRVLYVVAEGVAGYVNRIKAYCHQHAISPFDIDIDVISDMTPNLMEPVHVADLIKEATRHGPYDLIVMDTFAQVTPGANENSGEDMGKALAHCRRLHQATGAMVLLVHHSGKDTSKGARGWSGLRAAADVELEVNRLEELRSVSVTKLKDGTDGFQIGFKLHTVVLGTDNDGDDITSCIVEYTDTGRVARVKKPKLGSRERNVLLVLNDLYGLGSDTKIMELDLIETVAAQIPAPVDGKKDNRQRDVKDCIKTLSAKNYVFVEDGFVVLSGKDNA